MHQVAGRDHAFRRDVHDDVPRRMSPAQEEQVHLPAAAMDDEPLVEGDGGQRHARLCHLLQVRFESLDVGPQGARSRVVLARLELDTEVGDLPGQALERLFDGDTPSFSSHSRVLTEEITSTLAPKTSG